MMISGWSNPVCNGAERVCQNQLLIEDTDKTTICLKQQYGWIDALAVPTYTTISDQRMRFTDCHAPSQMEQSRIEEEQHDVRSGERTYNKDLQ